MTGVYLEGALHRALRPHERAPLDPNPRPAFDGPAEPGPPPTADAVLNPFSVIRKGATVLRSQLGALAPWHLVNIVRAYGLSDLGTSVLTRMNAAELLELIVSQVRTLEKTPAGR